ncbi:MAG: hypothetical protein ACI4WH_07035 [Oscillospiraceae bacterium]
MVLAIIGSRSINNIDISKYIPNNVEMIVSGGAYGVDTLAQLWAEKNHIPIKIYYPQYNKYGRNAPLVRNRLIVENSHEILAFWDGVSHGTMYTINYAKKLNKIVYIILIK